MNLQRLTLILPTALALLLSACGTERQDAALAPAAPVAAEFSMKPSEPASGDTVTFAVTVTQEAKPVDDASEVRFEWWKEGDQEHRNVHATFQKDGLYIAKQTVDEPGSYFVYYHVTARDFHTMKKIPFTVKNAGSNGEPGSGGGGHEQAAATKHADAHDHASDTKHADSAAVAPAADQGQTDAHAHSHAAASGHGLQIEPHFPPADGIRASRETALAVRVLHGGEALRAAAVQFEYWREGEVKHTFVKAAESQPGRYEANISFPTAGTYTVNVHVEAPGIHDHRAFTLPVE
jgi:hypothetical protein